MESINAIFFKDEFSWKKTRENYLFKRMIKASSRDHHQSKDDELELRNSKKEKTTKILGLGVFNILVRK